MYDELREMNKAISDKVEQIAELRAKATSMTVGMGERVQTTSEDRMANLLCKIVIAENELDAMVDEYSDRKRKVQQEIFMLDNEEWQDIMYMHYIEFKPMDEIARIKGYTVGAAYAKNNRAIKRLKKLVDVS